MVGWSLVGAVFLTAGSTRLVGALRVQRRVAGVLMIPSHHGSLEDAVMGYLVVLLIQV